MPRRWRRVRSPTATHHRRRQLLRQLHVPLDDLVVFVRPDIVVERAESSLISSMIELTVARAGRLRRSLPRRLPVADRETPEQASPEIVVVKVDARTDLGDFTAAAIDLRLNADP
jgi:hypothetical protein